MEQNNLLYNGFRKEGKDLTSLSLALKEFDAATHPQLVEMKNLILFYIPKFRVSEKREKGVDGKVRISKREEKEENNVEEILDTGYVTAYMMSPQRIWNYTESGVPYLKQVRVGIGEAISEVKDKRKFLFELLSARIFFKYGEEYYFVGENFISTFGLRVDMGGNSLGDNTLERNIHIAQLLNKNKKMTFIVREAEGVNKVYAALSGKYAYVKQSAVYDIVEGFDKSRVLGRYDCRGWEITHGCTRVWLEFPEKAKEIAETYKLKDSLVPGLVVEKSDVGECSITVRGTWRSGLRPVSDKEIKKRHSGKVDVSEILEQTRLEIFDNYTVLPERLCDLMLIDVTDPAWKGLGTRKFREMNEKAVGTLIKSLFKQTGVVKAISKKNEVRLYQALMEEFDPDLCYTAYDVCMSVMNVSERISGLSREYTARLEKILGKVPYADYGDGNEPSPITLVA